MNGLALYFSMHTPMSMPCCDYFLEYVKRRLIPKKEHLIRQGEICGQFGFVETGLLRSYYIRDKKEVNTRFMQDGDCCSLPESFFYQVPARENIQALEDSYVYYLENRELQAMYRYFPETNASGRIWLEERQVLDERRMEAMWMGQARDRYQWFAEKFPDLMARVPGKHLASYLGISEVKMSQLIHEG